MNEKRFAPCNLNRQAICLGRQGENNALRIEFDCSAWLAEYENAEVKLFYFAPETEEPLRPVLGAEGTDRVWIVSAEDTATAGNGVIELALEDEGTGTRIKSATGYTTVLHSPSIGKEDDPEAPGYVRYDVDQSGILTDEQKATARKNIGAGTGDEETGDYIKNESGAVKRENIADLAINNAKLNYEAVSNAKIMAGTIQKDRMSADAIQYLTGGPYVSVSYDGAARADITQGKHVFALRLIDDSSRNLRTWLINHSTYDGVYLQQGTDIEGPIKLLGRTDFIGGIHGDEQLVSMRMIADGVDITGTATDLAGVKTLAVYVTSTVNDEDGGAVLFSREKVLTFSGTSLTVENRWVYTGAESVSVERWPGCGLYSVFTANTLGYTTNTVLTPSMDALEADPEIKEASFWVSGTCVTLQALRGIGNKYAGLVESLDGAARIKIYLDAIHAPEGYALNTGDVLEAAFRITIGERSVATEAGKSGATEMIPGDGSGSEIEVSDTEPTDEKTELWIHPDSDEVQIPQIDDSKESEQDTWSSKKIAQELSAIELTPGPKGDTPEKGVDYWTEADKAAIVNDVLAVLPNASGVNF